MSRITRYHLWIVVLALIVALPWLASCGGDSKEAVQYHCPMHPTYVADGPGSCPICGMDLVPIPKASPDTTHATMKHEGARAVDHADRQDAAAPGAEPSSPGTLSGYSTVHASAEAVSLAGVRTAAAVRGHLSRAVRAVGIVVADETRTHEVHTRVSGWIESLFVDFTGQLVRKGDPLLTIYSPELVASQDEYLRAREAAARFAQSSLPEVRGGADELVQSARERLLSFDIPLRLVEQLDASSQAQRTITLDAPASGFVTAKNVSAGSRVEPGMPLFTLSNLSQIWIDAEVYEQEASLVRVGQAADVTLPYDPAFKSAGRVSYIYPTLDPGTRTLKVRVELANPDLALKPGMYADVGLDLESAEGVLIPEDAVLDSGLRQVVFVQTGESVFEPREVSLGLRTDGQALVLTGVGEGEQVVVKANFLLDSESRLKSAIGGAAGAEQGAMSGMDMGGSLPDSGAGR